MLNKLRIKNFALIEEVTISFNKGLTIITGETGSGKSILLDALSLLLGDRADKDVIRLNCDKCIVEGEFTIMRKETIDLFDKYDLDFCETTLIRREVNTEGKSRSFINDTPVSLAILKEFAACLIDIHTQNQTISILNSKVQFEIIDAYAKLTEKLKLYKDRLNQYNNYNKELLNFVDQESQILKDYEYNKFQFEELSSLNLETINQAEFENELSRLNNAEEIKIEIESSINLISDGEININELINDLKKRFQNITRFDSS